ncbi:MAG: copper transporter [Actinomycetaceae bacterium]|nr:copper transporter [Actinomycetaceae bacterium]
MVDFRYHLVSLISVFLALAVGVVLGAGPLQAPIASGLTNQVDELRASQARTSVEIEALRTDVAQRNQWIEETTGQVLPGTLDGKKIALIATEETQPEDLEAVGNLVAVAGGSVNQRVVLTPAWSSEAMSQFRNSLAGPVATHLEGELPAEAPASDVLSQAVLEILTKTTDDTQLLREILTDADNALLTMEADQVTSDAIIFVGPRPAEEAAEEDPAATEPTEPVEETNTEVDPAMLISLAAAVAKAPASGVVVGDASAEDSLIALVRAEGVGVTSVDSVGTSMAHASTVISLLSADATPRAFGAAPSASAVVPPLPTKASPAPAPTEVNEGE